MSQQRRALERALKEVEARLRNHPGSVELEFERARLRDRLGRLDDARLGYINILQRDPDHFGALNNLGMLLFNAGMRDEAFTCFNAAVAKHPRNPLARANLGLILLRGGEAARAREQYEIAVTLDPNNAESRRGLALALQALGEDERAKPHAAAGFRAQPVVALPYRGEGDAVRLLEIVSAGSGNVPLERFLDDRVFAVTKAVAEYCDDSTALPASDAVLNAIGDADAAGSALQAAAAIAGRAGVAVINDPSTVLKSGRVANASRFMGIAGVVAPVVLALPRAYFARDDARVELAARGLNVPLLLRSPGYHTGQHFELVEAEGDLASVAAGLPGEELLAIEFVDTRGADGNVRKYRAIAVDGHLYPLHLAIAPQWKVHYFSADMERNTAHQGEEAAYLTAMDEVLGPRAMRALESVCGVLNLDYAGVDFAIDSAGNVVVFEANATMIVPAAASDAPAYRRSAIARIEDAIRAMLLNRCASTRSRRV